MKRVENTSEKASGLVYTLFSENRKGFAFGLNAPLCNSKGLEIGFKLLRLEIERVSDLVKTPSL